MAYCPFRGRLADLSSQVYNQLANLRRVGRTICHRYPLDSSTFPLLSVASWDLQLRERSQISFAAL